MGDTITVACKLPNGLHADLWSKDRKTKTTMFFRGSAKERALDRADDKGRPIEHEGISLVQGGYGLTHGVDADWFKAWMDQNKEYPPVARGLIFGHDAASAADKARDQRELTNGMEAIDPAKPKIGTEKASVEIEPDERHVSKAA